MKQLILGTAGHIDHGKTSLIKALTGIDTDRLKEEKRRGITIELGFASLELPGGLHIGIVDVPGHEKFIKNMVAGATGIDIAAMVIAADEGVMPQTREHLEICSLLDIKHGLIVITKIDMVDEQWLELVIEDVKNFVKGTFLEESDIISVSSTKQTGLEDFKKALERTAKKISAKTSAGPLRLPVDRIFTMKGFGTVITGTLISGSISVGQNIMIYPSGITSKVRGLQVHNQSVDSAQAGMRTAVNFQGLEKYLIKRGDVLSEPDALKTSYMVDVIFHYLPGNKKPLKNRTKIRFHAGTSEIQGIIVTLGQKKIEPGQETAVQLRLDTPVALIKDDRFIVRSISPVITIGGGYVLNPIPPKHKKALQQAVSGLKKIAESGPEEIIDYHIKQAGFKGLSLSSLKLMTNISEKQLEKSLDHLLSKKTAIVLDRENKIYIHESIIEKVKSRLKCFLEAYHKTNPLKASMHKEELKSRIPNILGGKLFNIAADQMIKEKILVLEGNRVRLACHRVSLGMSQSGIKEEILNIYKESSLSPPYFKDVAKKIEEGSSKDVLMLLIEEKKLVKIKEDLFFYKDAVKELEGKLTEFLVKNGEVDTSQFKDIAGVSRKYLIPLLEYFDSKNLTIRIGDKRRLRKSV